VHNVLGCVCIFSIRLRPEASAIFRVGRNIEPSPTLIVSHIANPRSLFIDANQLRVQLFFFHSLVNQIGFSNQGKLTRTKTLLPGKVCYANILVRNRSASQTKLRPRIAQQCERSCEQRRRRSTSQVLTGERGLPTCIFLALTWPLDVDHCYQDRKSVYDATRTWNFAGSFELALSMVERVSICPRQFDIGL